MTLEQAVAELRRLQGQQEVMEIALDAKTVRGEALRIVLDHLDAVTKAIDPDEVLRIADLIERWARYDDVPGPGLSESETLRQVANLLKAGVPPSRKGSQ